MSSDIGAESIFPAEPVPGVHAGENPSSGRTFPRVL